MKKIFLSIALTLLIVSAGIGAVSYSVMDFLTNIQVNTTQMPAKGGVRWQTVIATERGCNWVDFTRLAETLRFTGLDSSVHQGGIGAATGAWWCIGDPLYRPFGPLMPT